jgi:hypothetical protein
MNEPRKRVDQYGVRDELATPEQLAARTAGRYDPRPASGVRIAQRLKLVCVRCGRPLGEVVDFEHRHLFHSLRTGTWTRMPSDLKCRDCYAPLEPSAIDLDAIERALGRAREKGRPITVKIGGAPK